MAPPLRRNTLNAIKNSYDAGLICSTGIVRYANSEQLAVHLAALREVSRGRLVVVVATLGTRTNVPADVDNQNVRVILTSEVPAAKPEQVRGWYETEPLRAVITALSGLEANDSLLLLFPRDWTGTAPETLLDQARQWRASPHSNVDDVFFLAE